jgi:hypothetical protein
MGRCLGAARKLNGWSERLRKKAAGDPSTKHAVETWRARLALPNSPLARQSVIVFPLL